MFGLLDAFFCAHLLDRADDVGLARGLALLFEREGDVTIRELARAAGTSERTLRRRFDTHVGLGPKRFCRVVRLQAVLRRLRAAPDWARVALDLGYADQAHLARETRELLGASPTELVRQRGLLAPSG
ncbi:MAG: helix-turn-helix transcriptional regulator [Myxococcales bacterium]|nr:helix-turn-helix transcriptional regulator [Myxococcales bacterium]